MTQPKIMICDGYNLLHRARGGFQLGDFNIAFNFFRGFRALVELHKPTRVYFVLEGCPKARFETLLSYKANRIVDESSEPEKYKSLEDFHRQKKLILDLMTRHLPVSVVRHQDFEGDDVIYNLIKRSSSAVPWVVVSNDTDFTQLLNEFHNVSIYNPIAKTFVSQPDFCYVTWKALRGDGSDNIPGIPGIGDKKADDLVADPDAMQRLFENKEVAATFARNYGLIKFQDWSDEEALQMISSSPTRDWDAVADAFSVWGFQSMLKEKTWAKFTQTFDALFG